MAFLLRRPVFNVFIGFESYIPPNKPESHLPVRKSGRVQSEQVKDFKSGNPEEPLKTFYGCHHSSRILVLLEYNKL